MASRKAAVSAAAAAAAAVAADEPIVECREVAGPADSLLGSWLEMGITEAQVDASALKDLGPALLASGDLKEILAPAAARRALAMGMDLARDPAVQRAIAARCRGVDAAPEAAAAPPVESEADSLRAMVRSLTEELDALKREQHGEGASAAGSVDLETLADAPSLDPTPDGSDTDSIDGFFASLSEKAAPAAGPKLPDDPEAADADPETVLGAALAVAALVLLVVVTRKVSPVLSKRAAALSAVAIASVLAKFARDK